MKWRYPMLLPLAASPALTGFRLLALLPGLVCLLLFCQHLGAGAAAAAALYAALGGAWVWSLASRSGDMLLDANGRWWLLEADGRRHEAQLLTGALVHPWCVVLPFAAAGRRLRLALVPDSVDPQAFAILRARLRWDTHDAGELRA